MAERSELISKTGPFKGRVKIIGIVNNMGTVKEPGNCVTPGFFHDLQDF